MNFGPRRPEEPEINLIPFIDVLLVVLIFLMLSTTYSRYSELQINLPVADAAQIPERPDEILLSVSADGHYSLNRQPIESRSVEVLAAELRVAAAKAGDKAMLIVSADALATHQSVVTVMDAARRANLPRQLRLAAAGGRRVALMPVSWRAALLRQWQQPGLTAAATVLRPLSWLYRALVALRRAWFDRWPGAVQRLQVPVIVVGNLVAGGAGKTPAVIALLALLRAQGWTPGVVSRGYGRQAGGLLRVGPDSSAADAGDEPLLIQRRCGVPVVVGADRAGAARALLAAHPEVDLVVADDGLQHLRLARDVEVIVFDDRGGGNGLCLPAGPLREPMPAAPPPRAIVLYSAGAASTPWPGHVGTRRLGGVLPLEPWWQGTAAGGWEPLRGRPVVAAAGLARPEAFFAMLRAQGLDIRPCPLPDHHDFAVLPWPGDAADVVVTEKDAVKLRPGHAGSARVWVATLDFSLPAAFGDELRRRLPNRANPP